MDKDSDRLIRLADHLDGHDEGSSELDKVARDLRAIAVRVRRQEHLITQLEGDFKSFNNRVMF